jgi:hypothetical protein
MLWAEMTHRISEMLRMAGERRRDRQTVQKLLKHWSATNIRSQVCVRDHCIVRLHLVACRDKATWSWRHTVLDSCWGVLRAYADQHRRLAQLVESHKLRLVQSEEMIPREMVAENDVVPLVSLDRQTPAKRLASCLEAHAAPSEGSGVKAVTVTVLEDIPEETLDSQEVDEISLSGGEDDLRALLRTWGVEDAREVLEANGFTSVQRMRDVLEVDDLPELGLPLATRKILARLLMSWADEKEAEQDAQLTQKDAGLLDLRTEFASQEEADAATSEKARKSAPSLATDSHLNGSGDELQNDAQTERGRGAGRHTFTHIPIRTHAQTCSHI